MFWVSLRIQVTLAAVTRFQFQRLQWCEVPAHHAINIFADHPSRPAGNVVAQVPARAD